jgi:hypothetical protein
VRDRVRRSIGELHAEGALVRVHLRPAALLDSDSPPAVPATLLVDTGASHTSLDERLVHRMGVRARRATPVTYANGRVEERLLYAVSVELILENEAGQPSRLAMHKEIIAESWTGERRHDGLLGWDFLRNTRFLYDGTDGHFELHVRGA